MNRKKIKILFVIYLLLLLKVIVFKYPLWQLREIVDSWQQSVIWEGLGRANFEPFRTIEMYVKYWGRLNSFENLVGNVVAFIPLGYFIPRLWRAGRNFFVVLLISLFFVCGIELFQLFSAFGSFDVDDIILNCMGVLLGYIFFMILKLFGAFGSLLSSRSSPKQEKKGKNE